MTNRNYFATIPPPRSQYRYKMQVRGLLWIRASSLTNLAPA